MHDGDDVVTPPAASTAHGAASVLVNGSPHPWRLGLTLAAVLAERGTDDEFVATAVNTRFVARGARLETPLWPDDRVVVFSAIVGG
jgi:sulfur carrier protein